jgi:hypothetical protein
MLNNKEKTKYQKRNDENYVIEKHTNTEKEVKNVKIPRKRMERTKNVGMNAANANLFIQKKNTNSTKTRYILQDPTKVFHATLLVACPFPPIFIVFIESFSR